MRSYGARIILPLSTAVLAATVAACGGAAPTTATTAPVKASATPAVEATPAGVPEADGSESESESSEEAAYWAGVEAEVRTRRSAEAAAPTTAPPSTGTPAAPGGKPAAGPRRTTHAPPPATTVSVRGEVKMRWIMGNPDPSLHDGDCDYLPASYDIQVSRGGAAGDVVAIAEHGRARTVSTSYAGGILDYTCAWSYSFTAPVTQVYTIQMFAHGNQPELKDTETLSLAALRKKAPTLTGSECFGMPASMPCDAFTPFD